MSREPCPLRAQMPLLVAGEGDLFERLKLRFHRWVCPECRRASQTLEAVSLALSMGTQPTIRLERLAIRRRTTVVAWTAVAAFALGLTWVAITVRQAFQPHTDNAGGGPVPNYGGGHRGDQNDRAPKKLPR